MSSPEVLIIKSLAFLLSSTIGRPKLLVFFYHRIHDEPDFMHPTGLRANKFNEQVALLSQSFNLLTVSDAVDKLKKGKLPPRAACITFDDGYADNHDIGLPILKRWNAPATFFVTTGTMNGGILWNDVVSETLRETTLEQLDLREIDLGQWDLSTPEKRCAAGDELVGKIKYMSNEERAAKLDYLRNATKVTPRSDLMMTSEQITRMHAAGMEIGAHTVNHPILTQLSDDAAYAELRDSKQALEQIVGAEVKSLAYPNGQPQIDYSDRHIEMAKELGYTSALATRRGTADVDTDPFQIPRVYRSILSRKPIPYLPYKLTRLYTGL